MSQEDIRIEGRWQTTLSGEQFFLRKEGEVLIFATHTNMRLLAEATTIYVDGTFEICPRLFYQVFTINAFIHGQQFPLVYGLLPGKSRDIYHQFFMGVKEEAMNNGQHISPEEIMTDFELALVQSLELEFPGARIHGCYFHFAQCLWRKVQRLGLVEEYKEDDYEQEKIKSREEKIKSLQDELAAGERNIDSYISAIIHCVVAFDF